MIVAPLTATAAFRVPRAILALLPPLVAAFAQSILEPLIAPHVWFLFFPALFISSWIGDRRSGLFATVLTTSLVWWLFLPPKYSIAKDPGQLFAAVVFFATGVLFVVFHDRLRKSNERLRKAVDDSRVFEAFLDNSSDFIGIADADGKPVYVNPAGRRMVGLPADFPVETTSIPDYYTPEERTFASDVIVKSMVEVGQWKGETCFRNWQTQQAIPVSDTHFMIREPDTGRIIGMGTVSRDISEIKRARQDIELSNRRLAQANEEVTRLYEQVTRLDALKTRFFANVSHELRTPLALILGPVEKHLRGTRLLDPELRRDLEVIERNARTVLRHVNDLLDVSRFDAGRLKPGYFETDAAALVRFVADHFSTLAAENQIEFVVDVPAALPVQTDADKLQRMLLNLLSNAFKVVPPAGHVRVSLYEAGPRFRVEVGDSGPGIAVQDRDVVFERFEQLERDVTEPRAGTGLGLSIVRDFAALLGGNVSVSDAPEGGALFVLDMPRAAPPGSAVRPMGIDAANGREVELWVDELRALRPPAAGKPPASGVSYGRVLVVEDNIDMNRFIAESLSEDGFDVSSAFDGVEGYDKVLAEHPDLVLTDTMMPEMSGDELVRRLRERPELNAMPIVMLSARADTELRVRLLQEGVQDYLDKPFSVAELRARVRNLVARKHAEDRVSRLRERLEAVSCANADISEAVASLPEESVRTVLQAIALNAQHLTGAQYAAAGIGGDSTHPFDIWAFVGIGPEQAAKIGPSPRPVGLLRLVSTNNVILRLRNLREHSDYHGVPPHHPEMESFLGVPIRYRGHAVGSLFLSNKQGEAEFTAEDQQLVELLAARAGIAIETARLYAAEGQAHAWLQAVVDQMPEGIILMDAEGRVTMENQSLRALTNARPPVLDRFGNPITIDLRNPAGEQVAVDDLPITKAILAREVTRGREFVGRRADDRVVPLLVSAAPILTADGRLAGAAMVLQDISTLKELERVREEWASIVAHDLRQPISVIALRSSLLLHANLGDEDREDVRQISVSAQRLSRMASDLMDASMLEARRMQIARERLDVGRLLRDVVVRDPLAGPRTRIRTPSNVRLFIKGDAQRLEQVVANLLANAVKYGTPDTPIDVELTHSDARAEIEVTNRGPGISPDDLPRLFDRYYRSSTARDSGTKGLGLGLYIARGLVESHAGRIWVESVPGDATTFHVTLPLDGPPVRVDALSHPELHAERL